MRRVTKQNNVQLTWTVSHMEILTMWHTLALVTRGFGFVMKGFQWLNMETVWCVTAFRSFLIIATGYSPQRIFIFCSWGMECMMVSHHCIASEILPMSKPWKVSHPACTYTVETSWYSQPPGEIPLSGEAADPGSLKTWEQVKFTSDSSVPSSCQPKCPNCSETGPSMCPAMTSCKLWPLKEKEDITCQKLSHFMWVLMIQSTYAQLSSFPCEL